MLPYPLAPAATPPSGNIFSWPFLHGPNSLLVNRFFFKRFSEQVMLYLREAPTPREHAMTATSTFGSKQSLFGQTVVLFAAGGVVTAFFSASLFRHAVNATFAEVLATGMIVPSFTWVVQLSTSGLLLPASTRDRYWNDLGHICFWGSVALLPAAIINALNLPHGLFLSALNVLVSVLLMAGMLFYRTRDNPISWRWPLGWCCTIALNMAIFVMVSWHWWR